PGDGGRFERRGAVGGGGVDAAEFVGACQRGCENGLLGWRRLEQPGRLGQNRDQRPGMFPEGQPDWCPGRGSQLGAYLIDAQRDRMDGERPAPPAAAGVQRIEEFALDKMVNRLLDMTSSGHLFAKRPPATRPLGSATGFA